MSDIASGRKAAGSPFQVRAIVIMLAMGIIGFVGLLVLGAYAPDFRSGRNGGAHALSTGATGFAALVQLADATGRHPRITRNAHEFGTENLLIVTPENGFTNMSEVMDARRAKPTLVVLPKWATQADPLHSGWVKWQGLMPLYVPTGVLAPDISFTMRQYRSAGAPLVASGLPAGIALKAPRPLQVITGLVKPKPKGAAKPKKKGDDPFDDLDDEEQQPGVHTLHPLLTDGHGGMVLVQVDDAPLYVLADPDLLNNRGMRDAAQAAGALALLDWLNSNPPDGLAFDVSLNGFDHSRSPLKLLFEPPFLPMTICIALALLLAGVQAVNRFGAPRARSRAIAFGKTALVDNSAALVRKAGREARMGGRYAQVMRERAVAAFAIPARLRDGALDAYLDRLNDKHRFTDLAAAVEQADDRESLLAAARALHDWQKEKTQ